MKLPDIPGFDLDEFERVMRVGPEAPRPEPVVCERCTEHWGKPRGKTILKIAIKSIDLDDNGRMIAVWRFDCRSCATTDWNMKPPPRVCPVGSVLGSRFETATLTLAQPRNDRQRLVYDAVIDWVQAVIELRTPKRPWIMLFGMPGVGKTYILAAVKNDLFAARKRSPIFTASGLLKAAKSRAFAPESTMDLAGAVAEFLGEKPVLILDEVGIPANLSGYDETALFATFDHVYKYEGALLCASNLSSSALRSYLGPRIISRFEECGGALPCEWESYRKGRS